LLGQGHGVFAIRLISVGYCTVSGSFTRSGTQPNCAFMMAIKVRAFLHRYFIPGGQK
jgi:hypothetical protein